MDRLKLKQAAKSCLSENKTLYLINIAYFAIIFILSFIPILNSLSFIVSIFLVYILTSIVLAASKGYGVDINIKTDKLGRYLLAYLAQIGIMIIPTLMYIFGLVFSLMGTIFSFANLDYSNSSTKATMFALSSGSMIIGIVIGIIGFVALIFLSYMLFPVIYLSLDDEFEGGVGECISQGIKMMKGHKWELFVLQLSFIPWMLLSTITFGIALIYVMPYMQLTYCNYYLYLIEENKKNYNI